VNQSGNLRVDNTGGPARGWIYVPYRAGGGYYVASASAADYASAANWRSNNVSSDSPAIFPWLNLDSRGNLYTVWVAGGVVYLSMSRIDDPCNDPMHGGRPAKCWTPQVAVSPTTVKSAVFPAVTAGDAGRIAITYMGTDDCVPKPPAPPTSTPTASDNCSFATTWSTYAAIITDALALTRPGSTTTIVSGKVNHRIVHHGSICTSGTTCTGDRSLLDMIDLGFDQSGRVGVVFMDNNNALAEARPRTEANSGKSGPFVEFAKLVSGPSLLAPTGTRPATITVSIPENGRADPRGDATWPNVAGAPNLRSLDLLGASVFTSGADLVARLPLADASRAGMARDLLAYNSVVQTTPHADRLQYVFRFSTADDVFHLSMEYNAVDGTVRFFGGKLDANDAITNGTTPLGAGYHTDAAYPVVGTIGNGAITLRAPLSAFGLSVGMRITGANAFALAGPSEKAEKTFFIPLRTVDASPPFDATLGPQQQPPSTVECNDDNVQQEGGWHSIADGRASGGSFCRNVGSGKTNGDMQFQFTGVALDLTVATGARGGTLGVTIDGIRQVVDLYRAPANPATPDKTGRHDLDFSTTIHTGVPAGTHSVRISNDSSNPYRDMVYVDTITISGGDILTPVGHRAQEVEGVILGTALAGVDSVWAIVVGPSATLLDVILETIAGTTVTIKDPSGKAIATATVDDGGVLDLQALADGAGTYALVLHQDSAGDAAFTAWEAITEKN
jgi:hypothetical protein